MSFWYRARCAGPITFFFLALLAGPVSALSLQDVIDDGGFTTANGLQFTNFQAAITGDLAGVITAADLQIDVDSDGFQIVGPIGAADGEVGDVLIQFDVTATAQAIIGAALTTNVGATGLGALASVDELLIGAGGVVGSLASAVTGGSLEPVLEDFLSFEGQQSLHVVKDILVDAFLIGDADGGSARVSYIDQSFIVPEPGTFALLGVGLMAIAGRRRL